MTFLIQKGNFSGAMINFGGGVDVSFKKTCPNSPATFAMRSLLHGPIEVQHQRLTEIQPNGWEVENHLGMVLKPRRK